MESIVALVIFAATVLMFERTVTGAWRGINAANLKTGAVTLALRMLEEVDVASGPASEQDVVGQSGHYGWRRHITPFSGGNDHSAAGADDVVNLWVEVEVSWRDGVARAPHAVLYRLLKTGRRPS